LTALRSARGWRDAGGSPALSWPAGGALGAGRSTCPRTLCCRVLRLADRARLRVPGLDDVRRSRPCVWMTRSRRS